MADPYAPCLEKLPTKLGHRNGVNVATYSSTMGHLGDVSCRDRMRTLVLLFAGVSSYLPTQLGDKLSVNVDTL